MSIEANKATITAFTEAVWRRHLVDAIDTHFADAYQDEEIAHYIEQAGDRSVTPREMLKTFFRGYFERRPNFEVVSEELTAEGDRVCQLIRGRFTEAGEYGQSVAMRMQEINIFILDDQSKIIGRYGIGNSRPA